MKKAVLLHGGSNNSRGNWLPWLKEELEKRGYQVWSPDLPESDHPNWRKWLEFILKNKPWLKAELEESVSF